MYIYFTINNYLFLTIVYIHVIFTNIEFYLNEIDDELTAYFKNLLMSFQKIIIFPEFNVNISRYFSNVQYESANYIFYYNFI